MKSINISKLCYNGFYIFVLKVLEEGSFTAGIFSASVADYAPKKMGNGKIKSGQSSLRIDLSPTEKVIEKVSVLYKELYMVTFKYEENLTHDELMEKARARLNEYPIIMANRKEDFEKEGEQVIWSVTKEEEAQKIVGKKNIAVKIADDPSDCQLMCFEEQLSDVNKVSSTSHALSNT